MPAQKSLKERVLHSAGWSAGGNIAGQMIRFASNLIMTRLLFPEDFGLMAVVQVLMVGLTLLSDVGTSQSLVFNRRGEDPLFRHTAWTLQVIRGFGIWLTAVVAALAIHLMATHGVFAADSTYSDSRLPLLVVVFSLQMVIQGFVSSKSLLAQRHLQLKQITLMRLYSQVGSLLAMVAWGYAFNNIWALVLGGFVATGIQVILSHTYIKGDGDRFAWDKESLKELMGFGRWVFLSSTIGFLASGGDRLLLGALEDSKVLGIYAIAYLLLTPIQGIFTMMAGNIVFPALSEVHRNSPARLGEVYAKFQRLADVALFGAAGTLMVAAPSLVSMMYDNRYHDAGWMLQWLSVSLIGMRFVVLEHAYTATGQSQLNTAASALKFVGLFVAVPLCHHLGGLTHAVAAISLASLSAWPLALWYRHRHKFPFWQADQWALPALAAGLGFGWCIQQAWQFTTPS